MTNRIETIPNRFVVGMRIQTSFKTIHNDTKYLAQLFMPRRSEVNHRMVAHVFSIQNYGAQFSPKDPTALFEKWVGVEVTSKDDIPEGMEFFTIKAGCYGVFPFKGHISEFPKHKAYIFQDWLPSSGYQLDQKAHFEILNESYSKDLQNIEEDIWIPIKKLD